MTTLLSFVQVIICVVLIFLVLMHSGKDAGLSGAFGVGSGAGPLRRPVVAEAGEDAPRGLLAHAVDELAYLRDPRAAHELDVGLRVGLDPVQEDVEAGRVGPHAREVLLGGLAERGLEELALAR